MFAGVALLWWLAATTPAGGQPQTHVELREASSGTSTGQVRAGDTLTLQVWINVGTTAVEGMSFFLTFDSLSFVVLDQAPSIPGVQPFSFTGGVLGSNASNNAVYFDSLNGIPGTQIDGAVSLALGSFAGSGRVASAQLRSTGKTGTTTVTVDDQPEYRRDTRYNVDRSPARSFDVRQGLSVTVSDIVAGVEEIAGPVRGYTLAQNYPNPFNPVTTIRYALPAATRVTLRVFNLLGQEVIRLVDEDRAAGTHQVVWNGTDGHGRLVAAGFYIYMLTAGDFRATKRMLLMK